MVERSFTVPRVGIFTGREEGKESFEENRRERKKEGTVSVELTRITTFVAQRNFTSTRSKIEMTGPYARQRQANLTWVQGTSKTRHTTEEIRREVDGWWENCREKTPEQRI